MSYYTLAAIKPRCVLFTSLPPTGPKPITETLLFSLDGNEVEDATMTVYPQDDACTISAACEIWFTRFDNLYWKLKPIKRYRKYWVSRIGAEAGYKVEFE